MRLFFVTDLHGSDPCFRKFLNAAKAYEAEMLVLGGDVCGKHVVPVIARGGEHRADPFGEQLVARSREELAQLLKRTRDAADYPFIGEPDEWAAIVASDSEREALFVRLLVESIRRWVELAEERLAGTGVRCLIGAGDDDPARDRRGPERVGVRRESRLADGRARRFLDDQRV